ncbi:MAG: hypothetical protein H7039_13015 [Bryobacteraceae bacterium]|nr:hypothetical protein [Bryobacteraceae bacterium]
MFIYELRDALVESLRAKVRNGELTERSLARLVGISQPHIHNVLKGKRSLSTELIDRCLYQLRLSALDVIDQAILATYLDCESPDPLHYSYLPVLAGHFGPSHPWPTEVDGHERFPVPGRVIQQMWHPVIGRAGFDVRMHPLFADGDFLLLDQSRRARLQIDDEGTYVIKRGRVGLIRRLRVLAQSVYLVAEDCVDRPGVWEKLPAEGAQLLHFVRARATLVTRDCDWKV